MQALPLFGLGLLLQTLLLLGGRLRDKAVLGKLAMAVITPLFAAGLGLLAIDGPADQPALIGLCYIVYAAAVYCFLKHEVLPEIDERHVLMATVTASYVLVTFLPALLGGLSSARAIAAIAVACAFLLAVTNQRPGGVMKVALYACFLVAHLFLVGAQFSYNRLLDYFLVEAQPASPGEGILAGMVFLFVALNVLPLLSLVPVPRRNQSFSARMGEVRAHVALLQRKFSGRQMRPLTALLIGTLLGGSLLAAHLIPDAPQAIAANLAILAPQALALLAATSDDSMHI